MGDRSQLNRGIFLVSKIICTVSAVAALCMCFLGQIGDKHGSGGWIWLFSRANDEIFTIALLVVIGMFLLLIASVVCTWLNIAVVSIIGFTLSMLANSIYWLVFIDKYLDFEDTYLYVGAYLFIVFCSIGLVFSIIQCVNHSKWKRGVYAGMGGSGMQNDFQNFENNYAQLNDFSGDFVQSQPIQNNFNDFQGNVSAESMTAPLDESAIAMEAPQPKAVPQVGTVTGINGSCAGYQVQLRSGEQIVIGKDSQMSNIVIDASYQGVSRRHVGISYDAGRGKYCVTDYSSNGTFVNGERLVKGKIVFIAPGSEIKLADDKNTFLLG